MAAEWMQGEPHKSREWLQPKSQYNAVEMCRPRTHATSACDFRFGVVPTSQSLPKQLRAGKCNQSFLHVGNTLLELPSHHNPVPNLLRFLLSHTHTYTFSRPWSFYMHSSYGLQSPLSPSRAVSKPIRQTSELQLPNITQDPGPLWIMKVWHSGAS